MANKTLFARILVDTRSAETFKSANPILAKGEMGYEGDTASLNLATALQRTMTWLISWAASKKRCQAI